MANLKATMFREYDIRGRESDDELNEKSVYSIGRGFGKYLQDSNISEAIIGSDARKTSDNFREQMKIALIESGINVTDIGTVTTPMAYWAQYFIGIEGLAMITASHNPTGWNGMKLGTGPSATLLPAQIKELYSIIQKDDFVSGAGTYKKVDVHNEYVQDLSSRANIQKKLKVLVNTGNGTAGLFVPQLLRKAGVEVVEHFTNVDTSYPNYTANPDGQAMMDDTGKQTVANGCDLGMAFDGDGDRLGLTDEKGTTIWPDRYMILLSRLVLQKQPGAKIVFDVKVSEALPEDIAAHGGVPVMWKTGHSYIKSKMHETEAVLAGEMSGHIFFRQDFYGFDDASFAALKLLEYLSMQNKPLSEIIAETPYYVSTPTIQVKSSDEEKYFIVDRFKSHFERDGRRIVDYSGARVYFPEFEGWGLVRASSNTPTLVLRFESKTKEGLTRIQQVVKHELWAIMKHEPVFDTSGH